MKKKLFSAISALVLMACEQEAAPNIESDVQYSEQNSVNQIADEYLAAILATSPFSATFAGLSGDLLPEGDTFNDISPAARANVQSVEDDLLVRISAIDATTLQGADWVLYETLNEALQSNIQSRVCQQHGWSLNHMFGWQNAFPLIAANQPISTPDERTAALKRWAKLPAYIEQDRANLEEGKANGLTTPKRVVARVIKQLDTLLEAPAAQSPFVAFAGKAIDDPDFAAAAEQLVVSDINPAISEYRDYLRDEYLPEARDVLAISALPNGAACYEALLRGYHTAQFGGEETYRRGQAAVSRHRQGVIDRGREMFGEADFEAIIERVKTVSENRYSSEAELIDETRALIPITKEKIRPFFSSLPSQKVIVEPYPDYLRGTGQSSRYEQKPPADGPAVYRINTDDWRTDTRGGAEIVAVHEGWPGHHLQIAMTYSLGELHPVMRLLGSTAYLEGWARYAEALAEEAGVYETGFGEITRRAWPARGMVVDPGLHIFEWTHEEAKAFLKESGRFDDEAALEARLDRIAVIPGQLTAYDTGGLEIFALRREAEEKLGERFDIKAFHDRILENGALPLGALRKHVRAWIEDEADNETTE